MNKYKNVDEEKVIRFGISVWIAIVAFCVIALCSFGMVIVKVLQAIL